MKRISYILALILAAGSSLSAVAVTDKEMEEARVIAAKTYLRYANNGSGYLDDLKPTTMAALEKGLKAKEKENLKAFKAIPVPTDYASWDKQKLVDYWAGTAFASSGLLEKGKEGKSRARKLITAMKVSAPSQATPTPATTSPAATSATATTPQPAAKAADATKATQPGTPAEAASSANPTAAADSLAAQMEEQRALAESALAAEEDDIQLKKADNHTWIYVVILCILVAVVVALVVFASNVMKKNGSTRNRNDDMTGPLPGSDEIPTRKNNKAEEEAYAQREKFAAVLASKNAEISALSKKLEEAQRANSTLKINLEAATKELATLRARIEAQPPHPAPAPAPERTVSITEKAPQPQESEKTPLRTIYLGRANTKGIFVRADRNVNLGNTFFRLDTTDGFAGSFRVVNDPTVMELALMNPIENLGNACLAADISATSGMTKIVTDSAGTAIFEDGRWKMIRKAKIHFE